MGTSMGVQQKFRNDTDNHIDFCPSCLTCKCSKRKMSRPLSLASRFKQLWHEMPDMVLCCAVGGVGTIWTSYAIYKMQSAGERAYMYKMNCTVIRDTDVTEEKKDLYN